MTFANDFQRMFSCISTLNSLTYKFTYRYYPTVLLLLLLLLLLLW
jgi:hypothetical protein